MGLKGHYGQPHPGRRGHNDRVGLVDYWSQTLPTKLISQPWDNQPHPTGTNGLYVQSHIPWGMSQTIFPKLIIKFLCNFSTLLLTSICCYISINAGTLYRRFQVHCIFLMLLSILFLVHIIQNISDISDLGHYIYNPLQLQ